MTGDVDFPVLVRHQHIGCDGRHGLDWKMLHDMWSQAHFQVVADILDDYEECCQLANYCDTHKQWIGNPSAEDCSKYEEDKKCETNIYLFCHLDENSVFRIFDDVHGFLPGMFG